MQTRQRDTNSILIRMETSHKDSALEWDTLLFCGYPKTQGSTEGKEVPLHLTPCFLHYPHPLLYILHSGKTTFSKLFPLLLQFPLLFPPSPSLPNTYPETYPTATSLRKPPSFRTCNYFLAGSIGH